MLFDYPNFNPYRAMRQTDPPLIGEDVYALQIALNQVGQFDVALKTDGVFGAKTGKAVQAMQTRLGLGTDGVAGALTQRALVRKLSDDAARTHELPVGLPFGQIAHESSCLLGNYSAQRRDRSCDAGVCQRNTNFTPPNEGFDPVRSIAALARMEHQSFELYARVEPVRRRWELACGSWNAPAFANYIAREEGAKNVTASMTLRPTETARTTLERYMDSATAYLVSG